MVGNGRAGLLRFTTKGDHSGLEEYDSIQRLNVMPVTEEQQLSVGFKMSFLSVLSSFGGALKLFLEHHIL